MEEFFKRLFCSHNWQIVGKKELPEIKYDKHFDVVYVYRKGIRFWECSKCPAKKQDNYTVLLDIE